MRIYLSGCIALLLLASCHSQKTLKNAYKYLEFSYFNWGSSEYSIQFTQSDTIYISSDFPRPSQTFAGIITSAQKQKIDSFMDVIPFQKLDTIYDVPYFDGSSYQFYVKTDSIEKRIFVHAYNDTPPILDSFANWLIRMEKGLTLFKIDTTIKFMNNAYFSPPIPPRINDTIKYTAPKVLYPSSIKRKINKKAN